MPIRESAKQTNRRVADQIEAAHKTSLTKDEVGIRQKKPIPTVAELAENDFLPHVRRHFLQTRVAPWHTRQSRSGISFDVSAPVDAVTPEIISGFVARGRKAEGEAIRMARRKAAERGLTVEFQDERRDDAWGLGKRFATVIDSGLFHVFSDEHRIR